MESEELSSANQRGSGCWIDGPEYNGPGSPFLQLCCTDLGWKEIASELNISVKQLEYVRDKLCRQLFWKTVRNWPYSPLKMR
jgi:hypothetical protein